MEVEKWKVRRITCLAKPKSASFTWPSESTSMLAHLISLRTKNKIKFQNITDCNWKCTNSLTERKHHAHLQNRLALALKWHTNGIIVAEDIVLIHCKIDICIFRRREACFKSSVSVVAKKSRSLTKRTTIKDTKIEIKSTTGSCRVTERRCCKWAIECEMVHFPGYKCMPAIPKTLKSFARSTPDHSRHRKRSTTSNTRTLHHIFASYTDHRSPT